MTLTRRLILAIVALMLVLGVAITLLEIYSSSRYYLETTQRLNASLAMYMVDAKPPFRDTVFDETAFGELARVVMSANPAVEVYALGPSGEILASGVPGKEWRRATIALAPVHEFLSGNFKAPLLGDDPRSVLGQRIFSAASIGPRGAPNGYLYVILDGRARQSSAALARGSYVQTTAVGSTIVATVFLIAIAFLMVRWLTGPLRRLAARIDQTFERDQTRSVTDGAKVNEIDRLQAALTNLEDRVHVQIDQIAKADRDRRALVAQVSHDLRTPLGVTLGYIESALMRDATLSPTERRELLARAYRQAEVLQDLVQDLGTLAELEVPDQPLVLEEVSLGELGHDVAQGLAVLAERESVTVSIDITPQDTRVVADLALIQRVLQNLLTNAIKATPSGGCVRLRIDQTGRAVNVSISDEGGGLDSDAEQRLALPSSDWRLTRWAGGGRRGLGLLIVGRLLALHGIRATVLRTGPAGSCIVFTVPAASDAIPAKATEPRPRQTRSTAECSTLSLPIAEPSAPTGVDEVSAKVS